MIARKVISAPPFAARLLEVQPRSDVLYLERIRLADGDPVALHKSYVPHDFGVSLLQISLDSQSLLGLLASYCRVTIARSQETMEPTVADDYEAQLLKVKSGAPLQLITGRLLTDTGHSVECHKSVYRGDRFSFAFEGVLDRVPTP
jgi:GntR family transcriptional regulator